MPSEDVKIVVVNPNIQDIPNSPSLHQIPPFGLHNTYYTKHIKDRVEENISGEMDGYQYLMSREETKRRRNEGSLCVFAQAFPETRSMSTFYSQCTMIEYELVARPVQATVQLHVEKSPHHSKGELTTS